MRKIGEFMIATAAMLALCAAISESDFFPWSNFVALGILAAIVAIVPGLAGRARENRHPVRPPFPAPAPAGGDRRPRITGGNHAAALLPQVRIEECRP